ncbi:MAG: hypothetical protein DLM73_09960 [Chthoniobacterales bacterium]|nr:MAG: hypothetical protein DLM73_09960 [Chthoniobacterales bacterium]
MIDLLRALRTHATYGRRLAAFVPALILADLFYGFHSFTLECMAFLATWLVFDFIAEWMTRLLGSKGRDRQVTMS